MYPKIRGHFEGRRGWTFCMGNSEYTKKSIPKIIFNVWKCHFSFNPAKVCVIVHRKEKASAYVSM